MTSRAVLCPASTGCISTHPPNTHMISLHHLSILSTLSTAARATAAAASTDSKEQQHYSLLPHPAVLPWDYRSSIPHRTQPSSSLVIEQLPSPLPLHHMQQLRGSSDSSSSSLPYPHYPLPHNHHQLQSYSSFASDASSNGYEQAEREGYGQASEDSHRETSALPLPMYSSRVGSSLLQAEPVKASPSTLAALFHPQAASTGSPSEPLITITFSDKGSPGSVPLSVNVPLSVFMANLPGMRPLPSMPLSLPSTSSSASSSPLIKDAAAYGLPPTMPLPSPWLPMLQAYHQSLLSSSTGNAFSRLTAASPTPVIPLGMVVSDGLPLSHRRAAGTVVTVLYCQIEKQYSVRKADSDALSDEERLSLVTVPVRILREKLPSETEPEAEEQAAAKGEAAPKRRRLCPSPPELHLPLPADVSPSSSPLVGAVAPLPAVGVDLPEGFLSQRVGGGIGVGNAVLYIPATDVGPLLNIRKNNIPGYIANYDPAHRVQMMVECPRASGGKAIVQLNVLTLAGAKKFILHSKCRQAKQVWNWLQVAVDKVLHSEQVA